MSLALLKEVEVPQLCFNSGDCAVLKNSGKKIVGLCGSVKRTR